MEANCKKLLLIDDIFIYNVYGIIKKCKKSNLKEEDYKEVKLLYFNEKVRKFLGGISTNERYDSNFKNMLNKKEEAYYWTVRLNQWS